MNRVEEFLKDKQVITCPICGATPTVDQPEAGTHCYSIVYKCGARVVTCIGHRDSNKLEKSCSVKNTKDYLVERLNAALRKESYNSYSYTVLKEALEYIKEKT